MFNSVIQFLYKYLLKPILFRFDPEQVHDFFLAVGKTISKNNTLNSLTEKLFYFKDTSLTQTIEGITFENPVGLSAGFDKNGVLVDVLPNLSFGYSQVGTVTFKPYEGNPKPRLTRLPKSEGIVVYYGLKNDGVTTILKRLSNRKQKSFPISISIGKTNADYTASDKAGIKDYVDCTKEVINSDIGHFYTINISCPNTFGGEPFTTPTKLKALCKAINKLTFTKPVYFKMQLAEWDEIKPLMEIMNSFDFIKGVIISNLEKDRSNSLLDSKEREKIKDIKGGLSGKMLREKSNKIIAEAFKQYGDRFTIVGVGGIFSADDAYDKIKHGASLVQLITGMIYEGPGLIKSINEGLVELIKKDGYTTISEAVGVSAK